MTWEIDPTPWENLILGEQLFPGVWTVETSGVKREIQVSKAKGEDGITLRDQGMVGPRVTCSGIVTSEEFVAIVGALATVNPRKPGGIRTPLTIVHPIPNALGIDKVYVDGINLDPPTASKPLVCQIECIQWFPQPKKVKRKDAKGESVEDNTQLKKQQLPPIIEPPIRPGNEAVLDALRTDGDQPFYVQDILPPNL